MTSVRYKLENGKKSENILAKLKIEKDNYVLYFENTIPKKSHDFNVGDLLYYYDDNKVEYTLQVVVVHGANKYTVDIIEDIDESEENFNDGFGDSDRGNDDTNHSDASSTGTIQREFFPARPNTPV